MSMKKTKAALLLSLYEWAETCLLMAGCEMYRWEAALEKLWQRATSIKQLICAMVMLIPPVAVTQAECYFMVSTKVRFDK